MTISTLCYRCVLLGWIAVLGGCHWDHRPAPRAADVMPAVRQYTIEQFLGTTRLGGSSFSPDGSKILVNSDASGTDNAYAIRTDGSGSVQLTDLQTDAVQVQGYFPGDERFLYLADRGGNELDHLYVRELDGTRTDLTPGTGHTAEFFGWAHDGRSLFVGTNERDSRYFDVYEIQLAGYRRSMIYRNEHGYKFREVSPDKGYIAFEMTRTRNDSDILLYDRRAGSMRRLTAHTGSVEYKHQAFGTDSKSLYFTSDQGSEFAYLVRAQLATGRRQVVLRSAGDVTFARFSHQGKYLVVGVDQDARTELRIFDGATMEPLAMPGPPAGDIGSVAFSRDESLLAFYASSSRSPPNLYSYDFSAAPPIRLTWTLSPEIDARDLVDAETARFVAPDGLEIPGLLYRPRQASPAHPVPALVWVHGGPGGQSRIGYRALIQYLVNHGYAVYAINNRGSSGYGKSFFKADDRRHGQADLDDCVSSKAMLIATGYVDPGRIGIIGASYGGYLALAALTFRPREFAAGVDLFGISNWIRTLENMPPWWGSMRAALFAEIGHPERDRSYLESISPLFNAGNIVRPLMVLQGANDPRVIESESHDMVAAARARGVPVEYLVFEDEGHGFRKRKNRVTAYRSILQFLDGYLTGEPEPNRWATSAR